MHSDVLRPWRGAVWFGLLLGVVVTGAPFLWYGDYPLGSHAAIGLQVLLTPLFVALVAAATLHCEEATCKVLLVRAMIIGLMGFVLLPVLSCVFIEFRLRGIEVFGSEFGLHLFVAVQAGWGLAVAIAGWVLATGLSVFRRQVRPHLPRRN